MNVKEEMQAMAELAEAGAASSEAENLAASSGLPPFQKAIAVADELPEMPEEIIEGVLLETHKMLLTGPSKANKTWCLINLAISVATGGYWIGHRCARRRVLYVDFETDSRTLQRRIATVTAAKGSSEADVRENLDVWPLRGKSCGLGEIVGELFCRCSFGDYGMAVLDPAYMIQDGDENNARDIREFFAKLDELCVGLGCTVVIAHHHSKGAQGLKSSIDRSSGSGVFGRAPDAVLDLTELVLEAGTLQMAREVRSLAASSKLTGWRLSFTLREFAPKEPLDVWFCFPLHVVDSTGLLEDCKPNYGGLSEASRLRREAENLGKQAALDSICEQLIAASPDGWIERNEVEKALHWSRNTVNHWTDTSKKFMRESPPYGKARIVRRPPEGEGGDAP